jgi:formamidopyrimidine-DNA glycosylase
VPWTCPAFLRAVAGARIDAVWRRAMVLLLDLAGTGGAPHAAPGVTPGSAPLPLAFHLRMTGRLRLEPGAQRPACIPACCLTSPTGGGCFFADARKFGRCRAMAPEALGRWPFFAALGPEPLELDAPAYAALLAGRRARIKALLLDQSVLPGWAISTPTRACSARASTLGHGGGHRPRAPERLHGALAAELREAIAAKRLVHQRLRERPRRRRGLSKRFFRVYGRRVCPCRVCATPLPGPLSRADHDLLPPLPAPRMGREIS